MTPDEIKKKIQQARNQGVPDEVTFKYLNDKGLIPKDKIVAAQAPVQPQVEQPDLTMREKIGAGGTNIIKDITGVEQNKSDAFVPSVIRSTYGSQGIAGVAQLPGKVIGAISEYGLFGKGGAHQAEGLNKQAGDIYNQAADLMVQARSETDSTAKAKKIALAKDLIKSADNLKKSADDISQFTDTSAKQALGTSLNAGITVATGGLGGLGKTAGANLLGRYISPVFKTLTKGTSAINPTLRAANLAGRVAENTALGAGYNTANNLINDKPLTENLGLATALSGGIPIAGAATSKIKGAVLSRATPTAENIINSLIKPLQKDFAYGKNPAQGILNEGIVANNFDGLSRKVVEKTSEVGGKIGELGEKLDQSGRISLDLTPALAPIDAAIASAAKSNNQTLFHSLNNVKIALLHDLKVGVDESGAPAIIQGEARNVLTAGYKTAQQFLSDIAEHTRFTGNVSDDKALNLATKRAYGITRDLMNKGADSVDPKLGAEIRSLNERYGNLLSAKSAINHRDIVLKRQNFLKLADQFAIPVSIASSLMTGLATGDWSKAGIVLASQIGAIVTTKALGSTASKTRLAQFLSKLAPEERNGILNSTPVLKEYYERLTGQSTPDPNAPKTKTLQRVEDYLKNPRLGLSVEDISKAPKTFFGFHKDDQVTLTKYMEKVKAKTGVTPRETEIVKETLKQYGLNAPENPKQIGEYIKLMQEGADNAVINQGAPKPQIKNSGSQPRDTVGRFDKKSSLSNPTVGQIVPKELQSLAEEAKKYKSAEEFAQKTFKKLSSGAYSEGKTDADRLLQQVIFRNEKIVKKFKVDNEKGLIDFYNKVKGKK